MYWGSDILSMYIVSVCHTLYNTLLYVVVSEGQQ